MRGPVDPRIGAGAVLAAGLVLAAAAFVAILALAEAAGRLRRFFNP